jgi:hypothetical protein
VREGYCWVNRDSKFEEEKLMTVRMAILTFVLALLPSLAFAHCDTLSGPVVADAKQAIRLNDVTPALKWVKRGDEAEVRRVFEQTLSVRAFSPVAQELADRFFFETLVRLHRAGEGAPYTGLRNEPPEPIIRLTDDSLMRGSLETLSQKLSGRLNAELTRMFEAAQMAKRESESSVEAGRRYAAAYIELTHFVERIHSSTAASGSHAH